MFRSFVLSIALISTTSAFAEHEPISAEELCSRLRLDGGVSVYERNGVFVDTMREKRVWRINSGYRRQSGTDPVCRIQGGWSSGTSLFEGRLHVRFVWEVQEDKSISVEVRQFREFNPEQINTPHGGYSDKVFEKIEKNNGFNPIRFTSKAHKDRRVVISISPSLSANDAPHDFEQLPIVAEDANIYDAEGNLWAKNINFSGEYILVRTHRGTVVMSYYSFPGSTKIGSVRGNLLEAGSGEVLLSMKSDSPILPKGMSLNVYGLISTDQKTTSPKSVHIRSSDEEKRFVRRLDEK